MSNTAKKVNEQKPIEKKQNESLKIVKNEEKEEKKGIEKVLSIEEKINKVEELKNLIEQRGIVLEALQKLAKFNVSANNDDVLFTIANKDNLTFKTSNPTHLKKLVEVLKEMIGETLIEIESQIKFEAA